MAPTSDRMAPSNVFSTTLPVNPSVTTTSTSGVMTSRPSTLPMKVPPAARRASEASSSVCVSLTSDVPLDDSSPIDRSPTRGRSMA